jgi:hypothetical protein
LSNGSMRETKKFRINVTSNDIKWGVGSSGSYGPVARALRRRRPLRFASISAEFIGSYGALIPTPEPVATFIRNFDSGRPVLPFSFDLDVPLDLLWV